jgi:hypothetical protein
VRVINQVTCTQQHPWYMHQGATTLPYQGLQQRDNMLVPPPLQAASISYTSARAVCALKPKGRRM